MKEFRPAKKRIAVSVGESVRILRELQGLSQNPLAERTGIPQATLSAIENDRDRLGVERAKVLARALKCHPAVLVFPGWEDHLASAANSAAQADARASNVLCEGLSARAANAGRRASGKPNGEAELE